MIKVAAYCRVSTDKDDQANSFESQQRYFREYIDRQPDWELVDVYADEGITGTSTKKRTAFNRMINDAYQGRIQIIVTKEISRFSRNIVDTLTYTRELKQLGVGVRFIIDGIDTMDPESEMLLGIMSAIAQEESRKTSSRVKWGQTRQMERGVVFGPSLLGYDVKDGQLTVNPEGAELVRLIFHKYGIEKKGTTVIARELREAGFKTSQGNVKWTNSRIIKILRNEKYVGDLVQKKSITPNYLTHDKKINRGEEALVCLEDHHEAIIDRELWNLVQSEIARRDRHEETGQGHSNRYALSGKLKLPAIAVCGPFGAVKEQSSGLYAQKMAELGFLTLAFDPSYTGESGGTPRYVASPDINTEDFCAAVDFLSVQENVDPERIGIIGICGWGGMAINAAAMDTRIKATAAMTMYDMTRVNANGYFDSENTADARYAKKQAMNAQRTADYKNGSYALAGGVVDPLPEDAPQFVKDYYAYYKTPRGYHPRSLNSNNGWNVTSSLSFLNMPILQYSSEIRSAVLLVHGEKAHSRYFSETAYSKLTGDNKELLLIPGASHTDLYDQMDVIPFEKLQAFFGEYLK